MVADQPIAPMLRTPASMERSVAAETLPACREQRELRDVVASKLMLDWSPEQIAGVAEDSVSP